MVLESIFPYTFIKRRNLYAFLAAVFSSIIGITLALLLFGANSGLISIVFTTLIALPVLHKMLAKEKSVRKKVNFSVKNLFVQNIGYIKFYISMFLGVFLTYTFFSFVIPYMGIETFNIFKEHLLVSPALRGGATAIIWQSLFELLRNNWWVFLVTFLAAMVTGDGGVFLIFWNASSWGIILGHRAITAAAYTNSNAWYYLLILALLTLPYLIFEAFAYILAAISGTLVSQELIKKKTTDARPFVLYSGLAILFYTFIYIFIGRIVVSPEIAFFLQVVLVILAIGLVSFVLRIETNRELFARHFFIFFFGILLFIFGALIEWLFITKIPLLTSMYSASMLFSSLL